jgi:hypothetical protein
MTLMIGLDHKCLKNIGQDFVSGIVRLVDKKNWDTQNFLHLYQAFNCQDKVKIKLTFTITGYYQSDVNFALSNASPNAYFLYRL